MAKASATTLTVRNHELKRNLTLLLLLLLNPVSNHVCACVNKFQKCDNNRCTPLSCPVVPTLKCVVCQNAELQLLLCSPWDMMRDILSGNNGALQPSSDRYSLWTTDTTFSKPHICEEAALHALSVFHLFHMPNCGLVNDQYSLPLIYPATVWFVLQLKY